MAAVWISRSFALLLAGHMLLTLPAPAVAQVLEGVVLGEPVEHAQLHPVPQSQQLRQVPDVVMRGRAPQPAAYEVRVVYLIPANRVPQTDAEDRIRKYIRTMQGWFADHMKRMGYPPKTFEYQRESHGTTPRVNVIYSALPDSYFHGAYLDIWGRVLTEVSNSGFALWQEGVTTLVIAELHVQEPDGRIREGTNFVGGAGTRFSGVGMVTGDFLARLSEQHLTDRRRYAGLVIPEIGPYALVDSVSFPWYEGSTMSSVSSSAYGATIHELSHGFGLWHDFRNDENFNGNLMGNGLRGMRGALFPKRFAADDMRLSSASALMLNYSRFFNPRRRFSDDSSPVVTIRTYGRSQPEQGLCGLDFSAQDSGSGLAGAILIRAGQVVADMQLEGADFSGHIRTFDYEPGVTDEWTLLVLDREGNSSQSSTRFACNSGYNRAPYPFVTLSRKSARRGEVVTLDAARSFDPDGDSSRMRVEWDLNGDGIFDVPGSEVMRRETTYLKTGVYRVVARLTDDQGHSTLSMPIGIPVYPKLLAVQIDIAPHDRHNVIVPKAKGRIAVAVLSSREFDAGAVAAATARFGPDKAQPRAHRYLDVNADGLRDVVLRFEIRDTGIRCGQTEASLTARTRQDDIVKGTAAIRTVGCHRAHAVPGPDVGGWLAGQG